MILLLRSDNESHTCTCSGNGNPTTYKGQTLAFDPENRMTAYGVPASGHATLTAGYTDDGMRAWKENASATRTYFIYDGSDLLAELGGTGALSAYQTTGADGLVSRRVETTSDFYTYDPTGSVATATNGAGTVTDDECYDAVGTREDSTNTRPVDFCGQWGYYCDTETGLHLCGHRYYDCYAARFLTRDPFGYDGGINVYAYCANNPITEFDPDGTDPDCLDAYNDCVRRAYAAALVAEGLAFSKCMASEYIISAAYCTSRYKTATEIALCMAKRFISSNKKCKGVAGTAYRSTLDPLLKKCLTDYYDCIGVCPIPTY